MPARLDIGDDGFEAAFARILGAKREVTAEVGDAVAEIIAQVRADGDDALCALTSRFDRFELTKEALAIGQDEVEAAVRDCPEDQLEALRLAASRIEAYHARQLPEDARWTDEAGVTLGWRWTPIDAAGLYVPGGTASYPSSVLMNAIPARVAGVERLVMVVPTPDRALNPLVLAAAKLAGVTEIYRVGGAQAIAALAFGTQTIAPVDKIVGPGNAFVAAAKRQVFGHVGIDSIAGPSEIAVIADGGNDPAWIAADLLSQSEHDPSSQSVLFTTDAAFADAVEREAEAQIEASPRGRIARAAWEANGAVVTVRTLGEAAALSNRLAPEHLELAVEDPDALLAQIRHAGAVFLGRHAPEAIGDYVAGPDHVLPTARAARYASGLSVLDFVKRTTVTGLTADAIRAIGPAAATLADAEGLPSHAQSVRLRLEQG
ncbi:histidinol dehydrogenase [Parvularcula dongshanensis]|uniref:Histidinol dehydrogenase n=1 Tax=Parvularcula dongshanensis TaxID=1173995 RepID=A0A840HZ58_9PROT|nr:histidinol dehydrogenase [Parvularcula dongshanensis]MBB4657859.1 histidinol dehydrogenase [Parvularcula dongshanensis]